MDVVELLDIGEFGALGIGRKLQLRHPRATISAIRTPRTSISRLLVMDFPSLISDSSKNGV